MCRFLIFLLNGLISLDRQQIFAHPVSTKDVPDYLDIVKHPMSWDQIDDRLDTHAYGDLSDFQVSPSRNRVVQSS